MRCMARVSVEKALDTVAKLQGKLAKQQEKAEAALAERDQTVRQLAHYATAVGSAAGAGALDAAVGDMGLPFNASEGVGAGLAVAGLFGKDLLGAAAADYMLSGSVGMMCGNGYRRGFEAVAGMSFLDVFAADEVAETETTPQNGGAEAAGVRRSRARAGASDADEIEIISMKRELEKAGSRVA